jgi:Flp pilus assembly pilin Flp
MLALIVLVALAAIVGIGTKVDTTFTTIGTGLPTGTTE